MLERILKNAVSLFAASLVDKLAYVLLFAILARKLSAAEFGTYNLFLTLILVGGILANLGMESVIIREVAKNRSCGEAFFNIGTFLAFISSSVAWPFVIGLALFLRYGPEIVSLLSFGGMVFLFIGLGQIAGAVIRANERMEILALVGLGTSLTSLALNLLALWLGWTLAALIMVFLLTEGIKGLTLFYIVHHRFVPFRWQFSWESAAKTLKLTIPFTLLMAYGVLLHRTDLLLMGWLKPFEEVAVYGMAARFYDFLIMVSGSMVGALYPILSTKINNDRTELWILYNDSIGIFSILGFGAALGIMVLAHPIIGSLFGEKYLVGATALRWLAWAFLFSVLSGPIGSLLLAASDQMGRLIILSVVVLGSNIGLNLWLIPIYSYDGAALSAFLSAAVGFIGRMILSKVYFGQISNLISATWRPFVAGLLMALVLKAVNELNVIILIIMGTAVYFVTLTLLGEFRQARYKPLRDKILRIAGRI